MVNRHGAEAPLDSIDEEVARVKDTVAAPTTTDAPAEMPAAEAASAATATPQWTWSGEQQDEPARRPTAMKMVAGVGGALLVAAWVGGFRFARSRRRPSRRQRAMRALRQPVALAAAAASLGALRAIGKRVGGAAPSRDAI